jgi:ribosome-binding protein aMBF1 (putative translation factor)
LKQSARPAKLNPAARKYGRGTGVPHPIDVHVGTRIRMRRLLLGMNLETLAHRLGITFQQVQKYEHGADISRRRACWGHAAARFALRSPAAA